MKTEFHINKWKYLTPLKPKDDALDLYDSAKFEPLQLSLETKMQGTRSELKDLFRKKLNEEYEIDTTDYNYGFIKANK